METSELLEILVDYVPTFGTWDTAEVDEARVEVGYRANLMDAVRSVSDLGDTPVENALRAGFACLVEDVAGQRATRVDHGKFDWRRVYDTFLNSPRWGQIAEDLMETAYADLGGCYGLEVGYSVAEGSFNEEWIISPWVDPLWGRLIQFKDICIPLDASESRVRDILDSNYPFGNL